jgi:ATP-dependent RNA helicase DeaD
LVNVKELVKIKAIESQMRTTFTVGSIPNAEEICEIQLMKLINKTIETEVKEDDIEKFMPQILSSFESLSKEEVIKKFVSVEFNRFIDYYERAGDLNAAARKDDRSERRGDKGSRAREEGKTRFFVNIGRRDGLNPGALLRVVCDATGLKSDSVGRIDLMTSFSFFEADEEYTERILKNVNGANFEGHEVSIEVTTAKQSGGGGGRSEGNRGRGRFGGDSKSGSGFSGRGGSSSGGGRSSSGGSGFKSGGFSGGKSSFGGDRNRGDRKPSGSGGGDRRRSGK